MNDERRRRWEEAVRQYEERNREMRRVLLRDFGHLVGYTAYPDPAKTWSLRVNGGDSGHPPPPSTVRHEETGSGHDENLTGRSPRQPGCEGNIPGSGPD